MKPTLVITGLYRMEYLAAAAAAYRGYAGEVDVFGSSISQLANVLEAHGHGRQRVDILGVGLDSSPELLADVVKALIAEGTEIRFISQQGFPVPAEVQAVFAERGASFSAELATAGNLVDSVAAALEGKALSPGVVERVKAECPALLKLGDEELSGCSIEKYAQKRKNGTLTAWEALSIAFQAADFSRRHHGDASVVAKVVRYLAEARERLNPEKIAREFAGSIELFQKFHQSLLWGNSKVLKEMRAKLDLVAQAGKVNVMLLGETGVGKQVAAEYFHSRSSRWSRPFVQVNCACSGSNDMLKDELFGHEKNSYTDARERRAGVFEQANGGVVFLDEIATAGKEVQAMLLKVLDGKPFTRIGGDVTKDDQCVRTDVVVVSATNEDLQQMVIEGKFRYDLYERLCGAVIQIPPLRKRKGDIESIANIKWLQLTGSRLAPKQVADLESYDYPGNVRELCSILNVAWAMNAKACADDAAAVKKIDFAQVIKEREGANSKIIGWLRSKRIDAQAGADPDREAFEDEPALQAKLQALEPKERTKCLATLKAFRESGENLQAMAKAGFNRNTSLKYLGLLGIDPVKHRN